MPLDDDEELVAIVMAMVLVARARLEHGPADHVIGPRGFFVDQELYLHVDPAVVTRQALDLGYLANIGAKHFRRRHLFLQLLGGLPDRLAERGTEHFGFRRHHCPPRRRYTSCAATKSLWSMPSPRHAFIISLAAAASGTGLPSLRPRSSASSISFCCKVTSASGTSGIFPSRMNGPRYPRTGEAATLLSTASTATSRATPPFSASAIASPKAITSTISRRLTAIFIWQARPLPPMRVTFGPIASITGFARSNAPASPPTITEALPATTVTGLPEIGASSMKRPVLANSAATSRLTSGDIVLMSA